jgi:hypothetical protein
MRFADESAPTRTRLLRVRGEDVNGQHGARVQECSLTAKDRGHGPLLQVGDASMRTVIRIWTPPGLPVFGGDFEPRCDCVRISGFMERCGSSRALMKCAPVCLIALTALLHGSREPADNPGFIQAGSTGSSSMPFTVQSWWSVSTAVLPVTLRRVGRWFPD